MKVAMLVNGFPDARRPNNSVFNLRTALELAKRVDLTILVPMAMRPGRPLVALEDWGPFPVVRVSGPVVPSAQGLTLRLFRRVAAPSLAPYLTEADIVHSVGVEFAGLLAGALRQSYRYRHLTQIINDLRNLTTPPFTSYPYLAILRQHLHGILCNSRALEDTARIFFPRTPNVRTAYRGTDLDLFTPEWMGTKATKGEGPSHFVYLGGLPSYPDRTFGMNTKGGVTLMEAWKLGEEAFHSAGSTLSFGGPAGISAHTRQWVSSLRYPEAIHLDGVLPPDQVPYLLRRATMVVIPSLEEGCPNLAFEALASGTPILASDIQPLQEVVVHEECGLNVPAGNATALKDAMVEYSRPERRQDIERMSRAARKRAEHLFDGRNYAQKLVDLYEDLMTASGQEGKS